MSFNPAELLRETIESFSIETDLETIDRIQEYFRILQSERDKEISITRSELAQLSASLAQQQANVNDLDTDPRRSEIRERIKDQGKQELEISKSLKSLSLEKQELSAKLSQLVDEFAQLDKDLDRAQCTSLDDNEQLELDSLVLKLMVYRKFGIKLDLQKKVAVMYNKEKNLTDYLDYGDDQYSDFFVTNYIWDRIGK